MNIILSWLNDFSPFGGATDDNIERVAAALNSLGLAVESVQHVGAPVPGVVTARVLRTERHPDAERVHRVFLDAGDGTERHVWCGAFNMSPGDVVPLATLGTLMPDGRDIQKRKILGIASEGMLCSATELAISEDHSGILILPGDTPLGVPIMEALGVEPDAVFELDLTRNRPDCWGHMGVARDLAARFGLPFTVPGRPLGPLGPTHSAPVTIVDADRCGRFLSVVMSGIAVAESAPWMQRRLSLAGMRPISNVVDVSNYVMLEVNQPNHAYDLSTLGGGSFRIRRATPGEALVTLDGVERTFVPRDLLICDGNDVPIGVAGIMGGRDSEISAGTTTVALEVAWFEPEGIGQSAPHLGLRSEASARFERGVDPYVINLAVQRFAELLAETCPNLVVHEGAVDATAASLPEQHRATRVRTARVNSLLALSLADSDIATLLEPIGFVSECTEPGILSVRLPSWRPDATGEIDVVEEIARLYGYDRIPKTVRKSPEGGGLTPAQKRRRRVREVLLGLGISEAMPDVFLSPGDMERAGMQGAVVSVANPLVAEQSVLRGSLIPGLLKSIAYNESHRASSVSLFEVGHRYLPGPDVLPFEAEQLCITLAGREAPAAVQIWEEIRAALGWATTSIVASVEPGVPGLHPTRHALVTIDDGRIVGALGEIDPGVLEAFGVTERVAVLDVDLGQLLALDPEPVQFRAFSRYPSSDVDLAFVIWDAVPAEHVAEAIRVGAGAVLVHLDLFDVYRGSGVPGGSRSLAYRLRLQAPDRTLTDTDVATVRVRCIDAVGKLGGTLR
ncbi:MAG: phenylalanine--tRNA ligase subunit beta [Actinomycetota bacterium]